MVVSMKPMNIQGKNPKAGVEPCSEVRSSHSSEEVE